MADQTLMDFFAGSRLTAVAQSAAIRRGVPRVLPAELYTPVAAGNRPTNDQVEYIQYSGNRAGARLVNRMSPARAVTVPGATRKTATVLNVKELFPLGLEMLDALKSNNAMIQLNARQHLLRQMADFNQLFETTKTNAVTSAFALGKIYWDANGNVLPSSSGSTGSIDFGIPTGNQITKDGSGSTYNIGDWSTVTTDIGAAARGIRDYSLRSTNYPLDTVLYGRLVPSYLSSNTVLQQYNARNPSFNSSLVTLNEVPDGYLGFRKWIPVHESYMLNASGTATALFDDKFLAFLPPVDSDWYEFVPGGNLVPNGVASPGMSIDQMIGLCSVVSGPYSYALLNMNPLSCELVQGDSFLPLIKVPGAYFFGTCA